MGKRKKGGPKKKPVTKKAFGARLPTTFDCPFCNHEKAIEIKLERTKNKAHLECVVCGGAYDTKLTELMEPIDVYVEWLDNARETDKLPRDPVIEEPSEKRRKDLDDDNAASSGGAVAADDEAEEAEEDDDDDALEPVLHEDDN